MTKTISLSDEAYHALAALKGKNKSFSEVVIEITKNSSKRNILDLYGTWSGNDEEFEQIFGKIAEERRNARVRDHS